MIKRILVVVASLTAVNVSIMNAQEASQEPEIPVKHQKMFDQANTNGDESLSKEEADAARFPFIGRRFEKMDTSGDGSVTLIEFSEDLKKMEAAKAAKEAAEN